MTFRVRDDRWVSNTTPKGTAGTLTTSGGSGSGAFTFTFTADTQTRLRVEGGRAGATVLLREGGNHTLVWVGTRMQPVARHTEINDITAAKIIKHPEGSQ